MRPPASLAESPRRTLAALGLSPRKSLGQNFLADRNVAGKIVALARSFPPPFLEIGPGLGALTELLADAGAPVVAVELDRGLAAHLRDRFTGT
ncbi:MAG: rRNA adenine N-6-methyltransferase family protein, partial [Candidatus Deferrimicrobium sp.]|nr:rRNA adenine N-6-methyltransferase family protein [Candidatus Deferrimicrobium sp.]